MTQAESWHSTVVVNCVFNGFLSYTAIAFNIITIQALRKTTSLSKPLKTLFRSLAVSDLCIGLIVQPLYTGFVPFFEQKIQELFKDFQGHIPHFSRTPFSAKKEP